MKKRDRQNFKLVRDDEKVVLTLERSVKEMEDKLKHMGIERPHRGPRISDPGHARDSIYSYSPPSVPQVIKR